MLTSTNKSNVGNARKILSFYRLNYGLSAPYTALIDSETMLQSSKGGVYLKDAVPKLLGGDGIKLSVTDCTVRRLRNLGEDAKGCELFARRLQRISCSCSVENETQCLKDIVDKRIDLIMIVCHLTSTKLWPPHVALIVLNKQNRLVFKSPSKQSIEQAKQSHAEKTGVLSRADKMLVQKATEEERESKKRKRGQNFGDDLNHPSKKKKKAKGPNPLSVKKSAEPKNNASSSGDSSVKANSNTEGSNQTKKRRTRGKRAKPATRTTDVDTRGHSTNTANNRNAKSDETSRTETGTDAGTRDMNTDTANNRNAKSDETSLAGSDVVRRDNNINTANNRNAKSNEASRTGSGAGTRDTNTDTVKNRNARSDETSRIGTDVGTRDTNTDTAKHRNAKSDEASLVGAQVTNKENVTEKELLPIESTAAGRTVESRNETSGGLESTGGGNAIEEGDLIENEVKKKKKQRKNRRRPASNKKKSEIN